MMCINVENKMNISYRDSANDQNQECVQFCRVVLSHNLGQSIGILGFLPLRHQTAGMVFHPPLGSFTSESQQSLLELSFLFNSK